MSTQRDFVKMITKRMRERDWSLRDVSAMTGMSRQTVLNHLDGVNSPTLKTLDRYCKGMGLKVRLAQEARGGAKKNS